MYVRFWKEVGTSIVSVCGNYYLYNRKTDSPSCLLVDKRKLVLEILNRHVTDQWNKTAEKLVRDVDYCLADLYEIRRIS